MKQENTARRLLTRYGNPMQWNGEEWPCLLQPLNRTDAEGRCYRCLSVADFSPAVGDEICTHSDCYTVLRTDGVFAAGQRLYTWCIAEHQENWKR